MNSPAANYRGRFAPSPTGPLHFGSLVAAVASFLNARSSRGAWLVRIEDLDPPREQPGAADGILRVLEACGLHWDESVLYQSTRTDRYRDVVQTLVKDGFAYPCTCSRSDIAQHQANAGAGAGQIYPGLCRSGPRNPGQPSAIRLRAGDVEIAIEDQIQGHYNQHLPSAVGDFVLWRKDGLPAYQLAVVIDDADQGITEVCRGIDLLDNTPRQVFLQQVLRLPRPEYAHFPVVLAASGEKLSKQTGALAVDPVHANAAIELALGFLGLSLPEDLHAAPAAETLAWASRVWVPDSLQGELSRPYPASDILAAAQ
ncbi:MAG: tRNA glutamyl-Q(34) synthetase GluQRS [Gammaproteobacteria bacterium]